MNLLSKRNHWDTYYDDEYEDRTEEPAEIDDCYDDYPSREELYEAALEAENWWGRY